uniref:Uncharacterized protein n=1 Tax=Kalanchoe fedtschenkoi TaxID=63787 RepID=A0A7N0ZT53_KALFE
MATIQSTLVFFFLLALITCPEIIFTEGRFLSSIDKVNHNKRGNGNKEAVNSRPVEQKKVPAKQNHNTYLGKADAVRNDDTQQPAITKDSRDDHHISHKTLLDEGKYNVEKKQQGYSPGVGHPSASSEDGTKQKIQVEGKIHDYSPGVGHSVPPADEYTKPEVAGDTSDVADKLNAGGKPSDYSPGVGHSFVHYDKDTKPASEEMSPNEKHHIQDKNQCHSPGVCHAASVSDEHPKTEVWNNNNVARDGQIIEERLTIESHSPGVGHSIQQKHAEPRSRK